MEYSNELPVASEPSLTQSENVPSDLKAKKAWETSMRILFFMESFN